MSAVVRTVTLDDGEVTYDANMPVKVLRLMSAESPSLEVLIEALSKFVISWPFEGNPADSEAWVGLGRMDFNRVVTGVMEDLGKSGEV